MFSKFFIGALIVTLVVGGVWFFSARQSADAPADNPTTTQESTTNLPADTSTNNNNGELGNNDEEVVNDNTDTGGAGDSTPKIVEVRMTASGFSPATFTIEKGTIVRWINSDSRPHWPASTVHPTHQIYPAFDPKHPIAVGEIWEFTFDQAGEWHFHDHLNVSMGGTATVLP